MKVYYFIEDIRNVTELYYNIMLDALSRVGVELCGLKKSASLSVLRIPKSQYILATSLKSFIILYLLGYRKFIYWFQGITPEEDYMVHHVAWRRALFTWAEKRALKYSKYRIGVSKYLFEHYENKYGIEIDKDTVFIMPCFNSNLNKKSFYSSDKYKNNIFCYAGGMQVWQGFDKIIEIYKQVEKVCPNVFLKVLSKDVETATKIIQKFNINNYSINNVSQNEMDNELSTCKFGFIVREDNIINNVATPTKLGTYVGNGVIPIFTPAIKSFYDMSKKYNHLCCITDTDNAYKDISIFMDENISPDTIYKEYEEIFDCYYNKEYYVSELSKYLTPLYD